MTPVTLSAPLRNHINETHTQMHDAVIELSTLVEEAMPGFRKQVSLSRTNTGGVLCNYLGGLNESLEALARFNMLVDTITSKEPSPAMLANGLMDIAELDTKMHIRTIGSAPSSDAAGTGNDISIRHLLATHGNEIRGAIKTCIKQCPILEQQKLNERFGQLYDTGRKTERR
jgi:hypothetical protein